MTKQIKPTNKKIEKKMKCACKYGFPYHDDLKCKNLIDDSILSVMNKEIELKAVQEACKREVDIMYRSLVSLGENGVKEIRTPIGVWRFHEE